MQLERELQAITGCNIESLSERWIAFTTKIQTFSEMEGKSNKKISDIIKKHSEEKKSFPPADPGLCLVNFTQEVNIDYAIFVS